MSRAFSFNESSKARTALLPDDTIAASSGVIVATSVSGTSSTGLSLSRAIARCASATLLNAMPYTNAMNGRPVSL